MDGNGIFSSDNLRDCSILLSKRSLLRLLCKKSHLAWKFDFWVGSLQKFIQHAVYYESQFDQWWKLNDGNIFKWFKSQTLPKMHIAHPHTWRKKWILFYTCLLVCLCMLITYQMDLATHLNQKKVYEETNANRIISYVKAESLG